LGEKGAKPTPLTLTVLKVGNSLYQRVLTNASQDWFFNDRRDQQMRAKPLYYDEHDLSPQRAYQLSDGRLRPGEIQESCRPGHDARGVSKPATATIPRRYGHGTLSSPRIVAALTSRSRHNRD
jgi:hypothetical protein